MAEYSSELFERAVKQFATLPGIGRKTATRLVLNMLRRSDGEVEAFANALLHAKHDIIYCRHCHNISDTEVCPICADPRRDKSTICVVENIQDVMAIEHTQQYRGLYHVLGGVISPMEGIGPSELEIASLIDRVANTEEGRACKEIIFALSPTLEGDTTNFFISRKLAGVDVKLSVIARGVQSGSEIEYADEVTLGRAILDRKELAR
ncbi:MAG: recombination protein RecR [Bacteroidaceae bacterium]|nr:recombination protein RecR [Bacteroidaceae bacterium]